MRGFGETKLTSRWRMVFAKHPRADASEAEVTVTSDTEQKGRTLTNLYNARPTWLDLAHKRLDEAVFAAYGWKSDLPSRSARAPLAARTVSDKEILEKLLALNLERSRGKASV